MTDVMLTEKPTNGDAFIAIPPLCCSGGAQEQDTALVSLFDSLPLEIWTERIIPNVARDWLRVDKFWNRCAFRHLLDDPRIDPAAQGNFAIRWASGNGYVELVRLLLADKRVDPAADNNYAIRWASEEGHVDVVRLLLADKRVDPAARDNFAIRWASQNGHVEVVELLKAAGCKL